MAKLNVTNQARRNAEAKAVVMLLIQRSQSGANGTHANRSTKRSKTRNAQLRKSIADFE